MEERRQGRITLALWLASLLAAIAAFSWMGHGRLGTPSVTDPGAWSAWVVSRSAPEVTFALGRLLVLGLAWYLVGVTTLGVAARWARSVRMVAVADALAVPSVRRLLQASLGLGLATASVVTSTAQAGAAYRVPIVSGPGVVAAAAADGPPLPGGDDRPEQAEETSSGGDPAPAGATDVTDPLWYLERAPTPAPAPAPAPDAPTSNPAPTPDAPTPDAAPTPDPAPARDRAHGTDPGPTVPQVPVLDAGLSTTTGAATWVTAPGDHFWSIAERFVSEHLGRAASDREVDPYWRRLVDHNRDRLIHPGDPDLIVPGQRFALPPLAGASPVGGVEVHGS